MNKDIEEIKDLDTEDMQADKKLTAEYQSVTHTSGTRKVDEYETFDFGLNKGDIIVVNENENEVKHNESIHDD